MKNSIEINGKKFSGKKIEVKGDTVIVDGVEHSLEEENVVKKKSTLNLFKKSSKEKKSRNFAIYIEGQIESLIVDGDVSVDGDIRGSVEAVGNVDCGDVGGSVKSNGSVDCEDVKGDVKANGSVDCGDVGGSVKAGGSVDCGDIEGNLTASGSVTRS